MEKIICIVLSLVCAIVALFLFDDPKTYYAAVLTVASYAFWMTAWPRQ